MKNIKKIIWITSILAISALTYAFMSGSDDIETSQQLDVQRVRRRNITNTVVATGIIKPQVGAEVKIGSRVSGTVMNLYVNIGDYVKKGQLLAEIDESELAPVYKQSLANLNYAETNLKYLEIDLNRMLRMNEKNYISQQALDDAKKAVELAKARVMQEKANVEYAGIQLGHTKIYASISGVIGSVSTQKGETVSAAFSSPVFVTIIDLTKLEIWAFIDETDIGKIEVGQKVTFTVDTYQDSEFNGTVKAIYPQAEIRNNVVNYIAVVCIENQTGKTLRPEMTASVNVLLQGRDNVIAIPKKALLKRGDKTFVKMMQNNKLVEREITTGITGNGQVEVISGLTDKDKIIVDSNPK
jgi:RND family efflux transporter MFP subunit